MPKSVKKVLRSLSSLKFTIACLSALFVLVLFGTLAQVNLGLYAATRKYFGSYFIYFPINDQWQIPIFPGALTVGGLLFINLCAAFVTTFKHGWKKLGITITHASILLLILGGAATFYMAVESQMILKEGSKSNFSESIRDVELVVIDINDPNEDRVTSFAGNLLKSGETLSSDTIPIEVGIELYMTNSLLGKRNGETDLKGVGKEIVATPLPIFTRDDVKNIPSAIVNIRHKGSSLGRWLLSSGFDVTQVVEVDGKRFRIELRNTRYYLPYYIHLIDFTHDKYPGTDIPKNFSSRVKIEPIGDGSTVESLIYMNHPLRYQGNTYFQASYAENNTVSILQVVKNPSWLVPYIACLLLAVGLTVQFVISLLGFLKKRKRKSNESMA